MIDKIAIDSEMEVTTNTLAAKLNEVIDVLCNQMSPRLRAPGPAQHIDYLEAMAERLKTGPYKALSESGPSNDLAKAIGDALTKFQETVQAYKKSLVAPTGTKATLEV